MPYYYSDSDNVLDRKPVRSVSAPRRASVPLLLVVLVLWVALLYAMMWFGKGGAAIQEDSPPPGAVGKSGPASKAPKAPSEVATKGAAKRP